MKKSLIILIILFSCSDPEIVPDKPDVFYPCDIESTPPYFNGIEPDDTNTYSDGHIVYIYNCVQVDGYSDNRSVRITWKFDTCWAYNRDVDECI